MSKSLKRYKLASKILTTLKHGDSVHKSDVELVEKLIKDDETRKIYKNALMSGVAAVLVTQFSAYFLLCCLSYPLFAIPFPDSVWVGLNPSNHQWIAAIVVLVTLCAVVRLWFKVAWDAAEKHDA